MSTDAAERAAHQLREELGLGVDPIRDVRGLLRSRSDVVFVERPTSTDFDGAYSCDPKVNLGFIYINATRLWTRRRFTMAHELGHHLLGHRDRTDRNVFDLYDAAEVDANAFAAELLMPAAGMRESPRVYGTSEAAELAGHYMVSGRAIIYRLSSLQLIEKKVREKLETEYDSRYYADLNDADSPDRTDTARPIFPDRFVDAIIRLYKDGEINREAAREALDLTSTEADDVLPAVVEHDDFIRHLHAGVSRDRDRRRV